jgi:hypothetical protein
VSILIGGMRPSAPVPWRLRAMARFAVAAGRLLCQLKPARLRRVLETMRKGARPATASEAQRALDAVLSVSTRCTGEYCLQRSIATAALCRLTGSWPEWRVGVRTQPFQAHSWVVAEGTAVGENPASIQFFSTIMVVPPVVREGGQPPAGT